MCKISSGVENCGQVDGYGKSFCVMAIAIEAIAFADAKLLLEGRGVFLGCVGYTSFRIALY